MHQSVTLWHELSAHDAAVEKKVTPIDWRPHLFIDTCAYTCIEEHQIMIPFDQNTDNGKTNTLEACALNKKPLSYMSEPCGEKIYLHNLEFLGHQSIQECIR